MSAELVLLQSIQQVAHAAWFTVYRTLRDARQSSDFSAECVAVLGGHVERKLLAAAISIHDELEV